MVTELFWIRHGETEWNCLKRFQGHQDVPLSPIGRQQAYQVAEYLKNRSFAAIYSSDLKRAYQTAEIIAEKHGLVVQRFTELRERHCGDWEGLTLTQIERQYDDWEQVSLHGGKYGIEKTSHVGQRFLNKCEELAKKHEGEVIAVVAHGMCMNAALSVVTEGKYGPGKSRIHNTGICHLIYNKNKGFQMVSFNDISHLSSKN